MSQLLAVAADGILIAQGHEEQPQSVCQLILLCRHCQTTIVVCRSEIRRDTDADLFTHTQSRIHKMASGSRRGLLVKGNRLRHDLETSRRGSPAMDGRNVSSSAKLNDITR